MIKKFRRLVKIFLKNPILFWKFMNELAEFKKELKSNKESSKINLFPCLKDKKSNAGKIDSHYFYQDLIVAQKIFVNSPQKHVDIGSRFDGFVSHVAVFREIEVFDIRPMQIDVKNVVFVQKDFSNLESQYNNYCDSISSLHALEHFGLGRYGDNLDIFGHIKGIDCIYKMLKKGGKFYFSVPVGTQHVEFNAHRVFSLEYLIGLFEDKYTIDSFSYVNDNDSLFRDVDIYADNFISEFDCNYGCGIFEMTKK